LVDADGFRLVLDLGSGAMGTLQRHVPPDEDDAIVLSHLHPDHCVDLAAYHVALRYGPHRPATRIPVIAPAGTQERIESIIDPTSGVHHLQELFEFSTPASGEIGPFALSFAPVNHPVPTYAVRVTDGERTLVYSGDTGESEALTALAHGADVMLCEATFSPKDPYTPNLHLTGRQAGEHATRANVDRLILTHIPPWGSRATAVAEASTAFAGSVEAAQPGGQYWI
jgi:ribonuclease BN (tRNA processing enzyme)